MDRYLRSPRVISQSRPEMAAPGVFLVRSPIGFFFDSGRPTPTPLSHIGPSPGYHPTTVAVYPHFRLLEHTSPDWTGSLSLPPGFIQICKNSPWY